MEELKKLEKIKYLGALSFLIGPLLFVLIGRALGGVIRGYFPISLLLILILIGAAIISVFGGFYMYMVYGRQYSQLKKKKIFQKAGGNKILIY